MALVDFGKLMQAQGFGGVQPMQSPIGQPPVITPTVDPTAARNQKLAVMLYALGGALGGEDPLQQALGFQQVIQQRQKQKQEEQRKKQAEEYQRQLQQAIDVGDMDKAFSLSALVAPQSVAQSIAQRRISERDLIPQVSSDGTYTTYYERNEEGTIVPRVEVNQEIIDAKRKQQEVQRKTEPLPSSVINNNIENNRIITSYTNQNQQLDNFIQQIKNNELQFGFGESLQDWFGDKGIGIRSAQSQTRLQNKNAFSRWKDRYVDTVLKAAKGPQTGQLVCKTY